MLAHYDFVNPGHGWAADAVTATPVLPSTMSRPCRTPGGARSGLQRADSSTNVLCNDLMRCIMPMSKAMCRREHYPV